jgi:hypothetical protein
MKRYYTKERQAVLYQLRAIIHRIGVQADLLSMLRDNMSKSLGTENLDDMLDSLADLDLMVSESERLGTMGNELRMYLWTLRKKKERERLRLDKQ